jgi:hypothetical protein
MKAERITACVLGLIAAIAVVSSAVLLVPSIRYHLRESELIEAVKIQSPADQRGIVDIVRKREEAVRELGEMGSVRCIPHIIQMWGQTGSRDHYAAREALTRIGQPAIPYLREVLRGQVEDPSNNRRLMTIITCEEMGSAALPLLPELLDWYRNTNHFRSHVVSAIRAIGEEPSVKEVSDYQENTRQGRRGR